MLFVITIDHASYELFLVILNTKDGLIFLVNLNLLISLFMEIRKFDLRLMK
jgi:hypothetical protein